MKLRATSVVGGKWMLRGPHASRGFTLIELIITMIVLSILVGIALPLAKNTILREREVELRQALRDMRKAIDLYKDASDRGQIQTAVGSEGYPPSLDELVNGVPMVGGVDKTMKFMRRVPIDPMTNSTDWGMRSYADDPTSGSWSGDNVFDVYTTSEGIALDGTRYRDW